MKKLVTTVAALSALTVAAPALAQPWERYSSPRADQLEMRIDRNLSNGNLSMGEARRLHARLNEAQRLEARYRFNGLSAWEARDLDRRYDSIAAQLRWERNDTQYRYGRDRDRDGVPNRWDDRPGNPYRY